MPTIRRAIRKIKGRRRQVKIIKVRGKEFVRIANFRNYTDRGRLRSKR